MSIEKLEIILKCLMKPSITIKDLQVMTNQSYEKSRRDFKKLKCDYIDNKLSGVNNLPNQREIPLNGHILGVLELWYGLNKEKVIENIIILENIGENGRN